MVSFTNGEIKTNKCSGLTMVGSSSRVLYYGDMGGRAEYAKNAQLNRKNEKMNQGDEQKLDISNIKLQSSHSPTGLRKLKLQHRESLQIAIVGGGVNAWANRFADMS